jgi:hypothetical protein
MKSNLAIRKGIMIVAAFLSLASGALAQPSAAPLTVQGLSQFSFAGVRSRAMGGTGIASANDASALFSNPAALALSAMEIRAGGLFGATMSKQTQEWVPMRAVPGLSVLFEGLTGNIKTPDSLGKPGLPLSAWSTLQKQYDNIQPNWDRNSSATQPLSLVAAMPVTLAGVNIAAGIGIAQIINLDNYYQNNNSMTPYLGQERPDPNLISARNDTLHVKWYQYTRKREGSVFGITPGLSVMLLPGLRIGASANILTGSSDDNENRVERGHLNIAISNGTASNFMVDTAYYVQSKVGTSKYSGTMLNLGLHFQQERYSLGVIFKPPMQITRTWDRDVASIDTTKRPFPVRIDSLTRRSYHESGKDYLNFPSSYALGIVLKPTDKWTIAFDYELTHLVDAELTTSSNSTVSHPWVNTKGAMRIGAEYRGDILSFRGGYREDVQAFSPDGSAIIDEPARGGVYSLGAGIDLGNIFIDAAYEYSILKYQDIYQSNVNYNTREQHQFMMEIAYRF